MIHLRNIRLKIIDRTTKMLRDVLDNETLLPKVDVSNDIGRPSFDEQELPLLHVTMSNEDVDEHVLDDVYTDIRKSPLTIDLYFDKYFDGEFKTFVERDSESLRDASEYIERLMKAVNESMQKYGKEEDPYPYQVIQLVLSQFSFSVEADSDPKIGHIHAEYAAKYQIELSRDCQER